MKILIGLTLIQSLCFSQVYSEEAAGPNPYQVTSDKPHEMSIITSGSAALQARLEMIRTATKSLDLEYFIFNPDTAGGLVIKELVKAAERGVKIRILVDKSLAVFKLDEYYAKVLKDKGVDLRYYNPASVLRVSSVQFRNHRKLIVKDGEEAITGGRNIGDDYFDLSEHFNFLDRDASVKGEIVGSMQATFERYWNSDITEIPKDVKVPERPSFNSDDSTAEMRYEEALKKHQQRQAEAQKILVYTDKDKKVLQFLNTEGKKILDASTKSNCPKVTFATDKEGATFLQRLNVKRYEDEYRLLRKEIGKHITEKVDKELIVDSPYFLDNTLSKELTSGLMAQKKKITILTNSLASTDAIHVSTIFNDSVKSYVKDDLFQAFLYRGGSAGETKYFSDKIEKASWGTHSKTMIFNDDTFMVGTFNIDNRSSFYNTEMAIFCSGSPELTKAIKDNIAHRQKNSFHLDKDGNATDCSNLDENVDGVKKFMYYLLKIPSNLFKFLL